MKFSSILAPCVAVVLSLSLASASAVLGRQNLDDTPLSVVDCANSVECKDAADAWTQCHQNARSVPSLNELPGAGLAECLCQNVPITPWLPTPLPAGRLRRTEWEGDLLKCIQCVENVVASGDCQVKDKMQHLIDTASPPPKAGFCFYPDEYAFRQASAKLRDDFKFPILLPMATLPPPSL